MRPLAFVAALAACAGAPATAQLRWNTLAPAHAPSPRYGHGLAIEPGSGAVLLFGGNTAPLGQSGHVADLWRFDGVDWQSVTTNPGPSPRAEFAFCDDGQGGVLLFGGSNRLSGTTTALGDTWRLVGNQWTLVATTGPAPRDGTCMVATPQGVLLFGGDPITGFYTADDDTWLWNGAAWTQLSPTLRPSRRKRHAMAFDPVRAVVVLFGGRDQSTANLNDTWEWDGSAWSQHPSLHVPPTRYGHAMAFAPTTGKVALFGGSTLVGSTNTLLDDTWLWDGTDWTPATTMPPPSPRYRSALVIGPGNAGGLLFGGIATPGVLAGDTFTVDEQQAAATPFGAGCAGPIGGMPTLAAAPGALPRIGTTMGFRTSGLPGGFSIPVLALGLSDAVSGSPPYALPFDLGLLGWTGCTQYVSLDATFAAPAFGPQLDFAQPVPFAVQLLGVTYFAQTLVFETGGVAVTNGLRLVVGS